MKNINVYEQILDISSGLFYEFGFANVSTNLIAKKCNISIGTLYYYFQNKQEILNVLCNKYFLEQKGILKKISNIYAKENLFISWIEEQKHYFSENPYFKEIFFKILFEEDFVSSFSNLIKTKKLWLELIINKTGLEENHAIIFLGQIGIFIFSDNINQSFVKKQLNCILESYNNLNKHKSNNIIQDLLLKEAEKLPNQ